MTMTIFWLISGGRLLFKLLPDSDPSSFYLHSCCFLFLSKQQQFFIYVQKKLFFLHPWRWAPQNNWFFHLSLDNSYFYFSSDNNYTFFIFPSTIPVYSSPLVFYFLPDSVLFIISPQKYLVLPDHQCFNITQHSNVVLLLSDQQLIINYHQTTIVIDFTSENCYISRADKCFFP